jgi:hypothetical protein
MKVALTGASISNGTHEIVPAHLPIVAKANPASLHRQLRDLYALTVRASLSVLCSVEFYLSGL